VPIGLLAALWAGAAESQEARELTAAESVELALAHSPRLQAARAEAAEAEAVAAQVRAGRLPALRGQGSYTRLGGSIPEVELELPGLEVPILAIERDRFHSELALEQPLFDPRTRAELRAATHQAEAASWRLRQEQAAVAFAVRSAYWSLVEASSLTEVLSASLAVVDEHLSQVRQRLEAGAALTSDLLAAETRRSEVRLEQVESENAVRVAQLELSRLLGLPLGTPVRAAPGGGPTGLEGRLATATAAEPAAAPSLLALEEQVRALEAALGATRAAWHPALGFVGRYVYARPNPYFLVDQDRFRATWEVGLAAQWQLWNGRRRAAEVAQARARLAAAQARLAEARDEQAVEVARQELEARRAAEAMAVAEEGVRAAAEALRVTRLQFREGVVLSPQVLEAEQAYRSAQAREARAIAERARAEAGLLHALGRVE
jgi:outer membrane protein